MASSSTTPPTSTSASSRPPLAHGPDGTALVPVDDFAIPRNATPEEIADFILFAASDQARFATGAEFVADGGFALGPLA
ncbi:SDR family oxidoreductase [Streptomyces hebeiensis]